MGEYAIFWQVMMAFKFASLVVDKKLYTAIVDGRLRLPLQCKRYHVAGFPMRPTHTHLDKNGKGEITCSKCGKTKTIAAALELIIKPTVNVKCSCGHRFAVSLERRKFERTDVCLPGKIYKVGSNNPICDVTITSVSPNGLAFKIDPSASIDFDHILEIEMPLGNSGMVAREQLSIKRMNRFCIGAEFSQEQYNYDLDFYLAPPRP